VAACLLALLAACSTTRIESVPDEGAARGYRVGMTLTLLQDRLLEPPGLLVPWSHHYLQPTVRPADYERDPRAYPKISGVVPAGTTVTVRTIERRTYPGLEAWYEVRAVIDSGAFRGRLVELGWISAHGADGRSPLIDPAELALTR
jgi:hypothetical protein